VRDEAERRHILLVLALAGGNRARAARILGISRKTLWKKLKRLALAPSDVTGR
jgi:DNA-binding NtrC family response regulator